MVHCYSTYSTLQFEILTMQVDETGGEVCILWYESVSSSPASNALL